MLMPAGCRARRERLWQKLAASSNPEWILISEPQYLTYFANYYPSPFTFRPTHAVAALLLSQQGEAILFTDSNVKNAATVAHVDEVQTPTWYDGQHTAGVRTKVVQAAVLDYLVARLPTTGTTTIGLNDGGALIGFIPALLQQRAVEFHSVDPILTQCKRHKDPDELAVLRQSMAAITAGHERALQQVQPGMSELAIYGLLCQAAWDSLGEQAVLYGDVVTGSRTAQKGGPPTSRQVAAGELVLLDFSVIVHGYRGDFTNTFVCAGSPTDQQQRLYDVCLQVFERLEPQLQPGTPAAHLDQQARDIFAAAGLLDYFPHHTGHGVGLGHPEAPFLVSASDEQLEVGDVITLEPGLYLPEAEGVRYERNYLITEQGYELLSPHRLTLTAT